MLIWPLDEEKKYLVTFKFYCNFKFWIFYDFKSEISRPHKRIDRTAPHHILCGVVYVVFDLRGAIVVWIFNQTAYAGWSAVLGKNRTTRTANTPIFDWLWDSSLD